MKLTTSQKQFIDGALVNREQVENSSIIWTQDPSLFPILVWNPLSSSKASLNCPEHEEQTLVDTGTWNYMEEFRGVRLLYHIGQNVLLISALYMCKLCGKRKAYLAHHKDVLAQLPEESVPPFHLFAISGVTLAAYDAIISGTISGTSFMEIHNFFERNHGFHIGRYGRDDSITRQKHDSPSGNLCHDIFIYDFNRKLPMYESKMKEVVPQDICFDHTFRTR